MLKKANTMLNLLLAAEGGFIPKQSYWMLRAKHVEYEDE